MIEIWIEIDKKATRGDTIIGVSNMGRIRRKNGTIEDSTLRQQFWINGKRMFIYHFIAEHFIPKTYEDIALGRDFIDHITHNPSDMNINDIRNLRWCTQKENTNFDEGIENKSKSHINKPRTEFGRKYLEHYGYGAKENRTQYTIALIYYHKYGRYKWSD